MSVEFAEAPPVDLDLYWYKARLVSIYDADTLTVDIDLGFGIWMREQVLRLYGIDAWELRGEEKSKGMAARDFAKKLLDKAVRLDDENQLACELIIRTYKDKKGKYGRWLAEVFIPMESSPRVAGHETPARRVWVNLNKALVDEGHAEIAEY